MTRLVIFDFDGTLADTAAWFVGQLTSLAAAHGFRAPSREEIEVLRGRPTREVIAALKVKPWKMPGIANDLRRRMAADIGGVRLFDGVPEMIRALRRIGLCIAVVSSNSEENVRRVLGTSADLIDAYDCGASLFGKAAKFKRVMRDLLAEPSATLAVGDEARDIEAARAVGARAVAVTWGYATADALAAARPNAVVENVAELVTACIAVPPASER